MTSKIEISADVERFASMLSDRLEALTATVCDTHVLPGQPDDKPTYFIRLEVRPEWREVIDMIDESFDSEFDALWKLENAVGNAGDFPIGHGFSTDDYEICKEFTGDWEITPWTLDTRAVPYALDAIHLVAAISDEDRRRALQTAVDD